MPRLLQPSKEATGSSMIFNDLAYDTNLWLDFATTFHILIYRQQRPSTKLFCV
jgi:hypothetical protein